MKKKACVLLLLGCIFMFTYANASGLLPSLSDTIEFSLPSLGEAINSFPDEEITDENGNFIEHYTNITEELFNTFSVYLEEAGASLQDYTVDGNILKATILCNDSSLLFEYNIREGSAFLTYPPNSYDGWLEKYKAFYSEGEEFLKACKWEEAIEAFVNAGDYKNASERIKETYYTEAFDLLGQKQYADAAIAFRKAGDYKDSAQMAYEIESVINGLICTSEHCVSALKADGTVLTTEYKSEGFERIHYDNPDSFKDIVKLDENTLGAIGLKSDGSVDLFGKYTECKNVEKWKNIADIRLDETEIYALKSDGTVVATGRYSGANTFSSIETWKNIKKIAFDGNYLIALDEVGKTYLFPKYGSDRISKVINSKMQDIGGDRRNHKVFAIDQNNDIYELNKDGEWVHHSEDNWYQVVLKKNPDYQYNEDVVTCVEYNIGKSKAVLTVYRDGTVTSDNSELDVSNWKLWESQNELERIINWKPEIIEDPDHEDIIQEAKTYIGTDNQKAYDLLVAIVEDKEARDLINNDKKLSSIRNEQFSKGKIIEMCNDLADGPYEFLILEQNKDRILVLCLHSFSLKAGWREVDYSNWKESSFYSFVNEYVLEKVLSEKEKKLLLPVPNGELKGDLVFILSKPEVQKYLPRAVDRDAMYGSITRTPNGKTTNARINGKKKRVKQYLETVGEGTSFVPIYASDKYLSVQPAMWLDLTKLPLPKK